MIREAKNNKLNYLSYLTPHNLQRYAQHMKKGEINHGRSNWKKGAYPKEEYLESAMRHLLALWEETETGVKHTTEDNASAVIFNIFGLMHEEYLEEDLD